MKAGIIDGTGPGFNKGITNKEASGLAIHLDAPQRLVFSKPGFICAEPSPDALQAYASSLGFGVNIPGSAAAEVAQALATSAGSIGLRTQSITLMRDHLYRICEAYYNRAITELDVAQLLRRSQDMTLGVLAIEQLTGAVAARQVMIAKSANADVSGNVADTRALLSSARESELSARDSLSKAEGRVAEQQRLVNAKETELKNAREQGMQQAQIQALEEDLKKLQTELARNEEAVRAANENFEEARETTEVIRANFDAARASASAAARGTGEFSESPSDSRVDANTATALSLAAQTIIKDVITKGHLTDSCISIMNRFVILEADIRQQETELERGNNTATLRANRERAARLTPLYEQCVKVFEANVKRHVEGSDPGPLFHGGELSRNRGERGAGRRTPSRGDQNSE
jgi:hypothetical protein